MLASLTDTSGKLKTESPDAGIDLPTTISDVIIAYGINAGLYHAAAHRQGLINQSFKLRAADGSGFFLQRLNGAAFADPQALMENIQSITSHLNELKPGSVQLSLVDTAGGDPYFTDSAGDHWRMFHLIDGQAFDQPSNTPMAERAAYAFACYARILNEAPQPSLHTIIPDFHNTALRWLNFESAWTNPSHPIDAQTRHCCEQFVGHAHLRHQLHNQPNRLVHNDTKMSNVMFDANQQPICVIDLDTTQQGLLAHDFGDMLRSALNPYREDDARDVVHRIDLNHFDALSRGYLSGLAGLPTQAERNDLLTGLPVICFELGLRFLTDHLSGDHYFSTTYPNQNLHRALRQYRLLETVQQNWALLEDRFAILAEQTQPADN